MFCRLNRIFIFGDIDEDRFLTLVVTVSIHRNKGRVRNETEETKTLKIELFRNE